MPVYYFTADKAIEMHDWIIIVSGGLPGAYPNALEKIEGILDHIRNDDYYPTFEEKVAYLIYSIVMNHIFMDGNKRSALVLSAYMLELNGYEFSIKDFVLAMEDIVVGVAANQISRTLLFELITELIESGELSESTKVRLLETYSNEL